MTDRSGQIFQIFEKSIGSGHIYDEQKPFASALTIPFVGFAEPIKQIPAGTLVRISLAR